MSESISQRDSAERDGYLGVEVRHLVALATIAKTRSFSAAGAELGYAQSAVSQQIAALERAVGHKLVERPGGPRPVALTDAGDVLLRHARYITARLGAAKADLDALGTQAHTTLRVGTFQSASVRLLPPTLHRFRQQFPDVTVELRSELNNQTTLTNLVLSGGLDLSYDDVTDAADDVAVTHLLDDPYVLICATDHPLARSGEFLEPTALHGLPFIAQSIVDCCATRLDRFFFRFGIDSPVVFRSDDNLTTQRLVASGLGVAMVPLLCVEQHLSDCPVAIVRFAPEHAISRRIGLIAHPDRIQTDTAHAFVQTAVAVVREQIAPLLSPAA